MRLYRLGDAGTAVRDIQDRLSALGYPCSADPRSEYGETTLSAVVGFQRRRGLPADGIVGPETWRAIYEAGFRLGDRLLYLRRPMLRGDDVAELQRRLNSLGFDAGKIDGILGSNTLRALVDFQQNRRMAEDGIAGPGTLAELRLVARATQKTGREAIRERNGSASFPTRSSGPTYSLIRPAVTQTRPTGPGRRPAQRPRYCSNWEQSRSFREAVTPRSLSESGHGGRIVSERLSSSPFSSPMPNRSRCSSSPHR